MFLEFVVDEVGKVVEQQVEWYVDGDVVGDVDEVQFVVLVYLGDCQYGVDQFVVEVYVVVLQFDQFVWFGLEFGCVECGVIQLFVQDDVQCVIEEQVVGVVLCYWCVGCFDYVCYLLVVQYDVCEIGQVVLVQCEEVEVDVLVEVEVELVDWCFCGSGCD